MPAEITHKTGFSIGKYLAWLAAMWVFGYVVGLNQAASEPLPAPEPSATVHVTPER